MTTAPRKHRQEYGLVVGTIVAISLALGLVLWFRIGASAGADRFPIAWFIIVAAILGSAVNEPFRQDEPYRLTYGLIIAYIFWKSAIAIVFAFLLYFMFIGGLISGDMFPNFIEIDKVTEHHDMATFLTMVKPATYKDIAKILVWSFVAGYSEKFVPNLIAQTLHAGGGEDRD